MSTRSIIVITGLGTSYRLYKHSDGYPTANLPLTSEALASCIKTISDAEIRWKSRGRYKLTPEMVVGRLIGLATDEYGMGAILDNDYRGSKHKQGRAAVYDGLFQPEKHLGKQWDLEWIYVINTNDKTVCVYGGGYTGETPFTVYRRGTVDPLLYVKNLKKEDQSKELEKIQSAIDSLISLGFKVNPPMPKRRYSKSKLQAEATCAHL